MISKGNPFSKLQFQALSYFLFWCGIYIFFLLHFVVKAMELVNRIGQAWVVHCLQVSNHLFMQLSNITYISEAPENMVSSWTDPLHLTSLNDSDVFKEKNPVLFLKSAASGPPGDWIHDMSAIDSAYHIWKVFNCLKFISSNLLKLFCSSWHFYEMLTQ